MTPRSSTAVFTLYDDKIAHWAEPVAARNRQWAQRQGYDFFVETCARDARPTSWSKLPMALELLDAGYSRIFWIDADAAVWSLDLTLDEVLGSAPTVFDMYFGQDRSGINGGVWVAYNTPDVRNFLHCCNTQYDDAPDAETLGIKDGLWEQKAFRHMHLMGLAPFMCTDAVRLQGFVGRGNKSGPGFVPGRHLVCHASGGFSWAPDAFRREWAARLGTSEVAIMMARHPGLAKPQIMTGDALIWKIGRYAESRGIKILVSHGHQKALIDPEAPQNDRHKLLAPMRTQMVRDVLEAYPLCTHILWLDSDAFEAPRDLIPELLHTSLTHGGASVGALSIMARSDQFYDVSGYTHKGKAACSYPPYFPEECRVNPTLMKLDGSIGNASLHAAGVYRDGGCHYDKQPEGFACWWGISRSAVNQGLDLLLRTDVAVRGWEHSVLGEVRNSNKVPMHDVGKPGAEGQLYRSVCTQPMQPQGSVDTSRPSTRPPHGKRPSVAEMLKRRQPARR